MSQAKFPICDEHLTNRYTPCGPLSVYHGLQCDHRIKAQYIWETCGANCKVPGPGKVYICPECLLYDVRLEVTFESLDTNTPGEDVVMEDAGMSRQDKIKHIAKSLLQKRLAQGQRVCTNVAKLDDPTLQLFDSILTENGHEGIDEEPGFQSGRLRPCTTPKTHSEDQELTEEFFKEEWDRLERDQVLPSAGSDVEDEVMNAVGEALSACTLT